MRSCPLGFLLLFLGTVSCSQGFYGYLVSTVSTGKASLSCSSGTMTTTGASEYSIAMNCPSAVTRVTTWHTRTITITLGSKLDDTHSSGTFTSLSTSISASPALDSASQNLSIDSCFGFSAAATSSKKSLSSSCNSAIDQSSVADAIPTILFSPERILSVTSMTLTVAFSKNFTIAHPTSSSTMILPETKVSTTMTPAHTTLSSHYGGSATMTSLFPWYPPPFTGSGNTIRPSLLVLLWIVSVGSICIS